MFRASRYLAELELYQPDILLACRQAIQGALAILISYGLMKPHFLPARMTLLIML